MLVVRLSDSSSFHFSPKRKEMALVPVSRSGSALMSELIEEADEKSAPE